MKILIYTLFSVLSLFLLSSCGDGCTDPKTEFFWNPDSNIRTREDSTFVENDSLVALTDFAIVQGSDNVFEVRFMGEFCEDIADSGGGYRLVIMMPSDSIDSFRYADAELRETSAYFEPFGFVEDVAHFIREGEVIGRRLDEESWQLSIDVVTTPQIEQFGLGPLNFVFDDEFSLQ